MFTIKDKEKDANIFQLEAEQLLTVSLKLKRANIKVMDIWDMDGIPLNVFPYSDILSSMYICVKESQMPLFLQILDSEKEEGKHLRVYKLENLKDLFGKNYGYRPFISIPNKNILFYTTFFCQKLMHSEEFAENIDLDLNFLETLEITDKSKDSAKGYYRTVEHMFNQKFLTTIDTGLFVVESKKIENGYQVNTNLTDIREVIKYYETPYDSLFQIPAKNGVSDFKMEEYYIDYENFFIHFEAGNDKIEIYNKDQDGHLLPFTRKVITRTEPNDEFEKKVIRFLEEKPYLLEMKFSK